MYTECTKAMNTLLKGEIETARNDVKKSQLTWFYGSKATPKRIFGEDTHELQAFYQAQESVAPGACYMMRELLDSWQPYATHHSHTLPDGYHAVVPVLQKFKSKIEIDELDHATISYIYEDIAGSETGLAVAANMTHAVDAFLVREMGRRCNYNREQLERVRDLILANAGNITTNRIGTHFIELAARNHQFVSLRGVEFITEESILKFSTEYRADLYQLILEILMRPSFPILAVHDEFKCHANYVDDMRGTYMTILAELADSRVGEQIIQEVRKDPCYRLEKFSTDLGDEIMQSEYFLS